MGNLTKEQIEAVRKNPTDYRHIGVYYELTEDFLREFQFYVNWDSVTLYQKFSEAFLIEFIDKINIYCLSCNNKIPQEVKEKIIAMKELMS
jgi:hypothetical protein